MAREPATKKRRLSPPGEDGADGNGLPGFTRWNLEQDYEQRARKGKKKDDKHTRLPIKTAEGQIIEHKPDPEAVKDEDQDSFLASDDDEAVDSAVAVKPEPQKPKLSFKEQIVKAKEDLARIAGQLSESPDENIALLSTLREIAGSDNPTVKKLALGTQLAVFKDIIPGYRIRPLSKDDLQAKVGKDVKKLRSFEQGLLGGYKDYIGELARLAKSSGGNDAVAASLASVAISCACTLIISVPHFNFRPELISILITKLAARNPDQDFNRCAQALEQTFRDDEDGHISLDAVTQLTQLVKKKDYWVHEDVLNTFLHLRLLNEFSGKGSTERVDRVREDADEPQLKKPKQKREFRTKRERKVLRERKDVEKELKEADAAVSYEERDKNQAETLKLVFVAYFRILKARTSHLMGAVLEGLARYAHLINQDFFGDVLEVLKDLVREAELSLTAEVEGEDVDEDSIESTRDATRESLLCITTAFALLQGQTDVTKSASSLHLDLNFFTEHLYSLLLPSAMDSTLELSSKTPQPADPNNLPTQTAKVNAATTTVLLLRSLHAVLLPPTNTKQVPPRRVQAFTKQLLTASLHLPPKSARAVLALLQQVTKTHSNKIKALWDTEERRGDGVFNPLIGVESANAGAATVWEGELLRLHYDPAVKDSVKAVEKIAAEK